VGISDQYTKEIRKEFSLSATWFPDVQLTVGDVAMFERGEIHLVSSLKEYGIPFSVRTSTPGRKYNYNSEGAVSFTFKAAGQAPLPGVNIGKADAGVSVKFNSKNAILFNTIDTKLDVIQNMKTVGKQIAQKRKENDWDKKYFVITQCVVADGATIIISRGKDSQMDFTASGDLKVANLNLADLNLKLKATNTLKIAFEHYAKKNSTPLFEAWGFKRKFIFWRESETGPLGIVARRDKVTKKKGKVRVEVFDRVDYHDPPGVTL
jgi:hypothetical protein